MSTEMEMAEHYYQQNQIRDDHEEAAKYRERWLLLLREEIQRMAKEGVDPYIAWLSLVDTSD